MVKIACQYPGCDYSSENDSENVACTMLSSHNAVHLQPPTPTSTHVRTYNKPPPISRPEIKQDISAEEWYSVQEEWKRYKRITKLPESEFADQLFQCCERPLARLLLKENPDIIEEGEKALTEAIKKMAVLQVAISVRRFKLLSTKQEPGQLFREFFANVRASASTCDYTVPCPHACCREKEHIDYTSRVVKDILVAGIVDNDIRQDVLGNPQLDSKIDKDIVKFVEEKEMAKNACKETSRADINAMSAYRKQSKDDTKHKLALKGKCNKCGKEFNLYMRYRSGKVNKEPFPTCVECFRIEKDKPSNKGRVIENSALTNFIESMSSYDRDRAESDPLS